MTGDIQPCNSPWPDPGAASLGVIEIFLGDVDDVAGNDLYVSLWLIIHQDVDLLMTCLTERVKKHVDAKIRRSDLCAPRTLEPGYVLHSVVPNPSQRMWRALVYQQI